MKVLLTGSSGQLGNALKKASPEEIHLLAPNKDQLDLMDVRGCFDYVNRFKPDFIINCAAYTNVDNAESFEKETFIINRDAPKAFAEALRNYDGQLIHISTDYVFDGDNNQPYLTEDKPNPLSIYGKSKAEGESEILKTLGKTNQVVILRTSWLYSYFRNNFVLTMLRLHKEKEEIKVVSDQYGSPTSCTSLSSACWEIVNFICRNKNISNSIKPLLHFSNLGIASWYDLSVAVGEIALELGLLKKRAKVIPIYSKDYITKVKRPKFSVLDTSLIYSKINLPLLNWRESLYLELQNLI